MSVIQYLEESATRNPNKIAFIDENNAITYMDLLDKSKRIASYIISNYNTINMPIAVMINRDIESIISFMGIAMSRNFYVPIEFYTAIAKSHNYFRTDGTTIYNLDWEYL